MVECDEVAVKTGDWLAAVNGDRDAENRIAKKINGIVLYMHAFPVGDEETVVTVREIEQRTGLRITLTIGFDGPR